MCKAVLAWWDECVVEPGQVVHRQIEPLEVGLGGQQSINILHLILGQVQRGQVLEGGKGLLLQAKETVGT